MDKRSFSTPVDLHDIAVTDSFWRQEMELVRQAVIPYQWEALNDRVEGAAPSWCLHNFRAAAKLMRRKKAEGAAFKPPVYDPSRRFNALPADPSQADEDTFYGYVFQDSDFSKWIEAVGYSLAQHPDPALEALADGAIDLVCAAQDDTGYLDTHYIVNGMDQAFTNLKDNHELYCLGHLVEAAVSYYQGTGKDKLLKAACRFADYVDERFGPEEGKMRGYPGHEITEMALLRLYEVTGEEKYRRLACFFLDERGATPNYFELEGRRRAEREGKPFKPADYSYYQAHKPVREQEEIVGHAVRAMYLCSGMADAARLNRDEALLDACRRLWRSTVREKMYITGGVGGTAHGEAFSFPFDLPNGLAYSESCAAIGLAFFARRMLEIEPKAEYGDVMELALYNTVLAGMALDGKSFFYVNPLSVNPEACRRDARFEHVKPVRQKWFGCACCPPNIARIVSSVGAYAWTRSDTTLYTHLYLGGSVRFKGLALELTTGMPWSGDGKAVVHAEAPISCTLAFRLPGWSDGAQVACPGKQTEIRNGYCYLSGAWREGDEIALRFPMRARLRVADARVREDAGKAALTRGPIVYCLEQADNGPDLHLARLSPEALGAACEHVEVLDGKIGGHPVKLLRAPGKRLVQKEGGALYTDYEAPVFRDAALTFIPYFTWANRGEGEMDVWVRTV
ncbi:MAG: glycoside hydrolase family 127 protein [Clostridia bacterium]|nr:glycoside hydrolase family 127 protein [Clostridia bacterium]